MVVGEWLFDPVAEQILQYPGQVVDSALQGFDRFRFAPEAIQRQADAVARLCKHILGVAHAQLQCLCVATVEQQQADQFRPIAVVVVRIQPQVQRHQVLEPIIVLVEQVDVVREEAEGGPIVTHDPWHRTFAVIRPRALEHVGAAFENGLVPPVVESAQ